MSQKLLAAGLFIVATGWLGATDEPAQGKLAWTTDTEKMTIPDAAIAGKVQGNEFKPTFIVFRTFTRTLSISQSSGGVHPEVDVLITLPIQGKGKLDGGKFVLSPKAKTGKQPSASLLTSPDGKKLPAEVNMTAGQTALKLEFGDEKDGQIPGKIYICLGDNKKSYFAGTFQARIAR